MQHPPSVLFKGHSAPTWRTGLFAPSHGTSLTGVLGKCGLEPAGVDSRLRGYVQSHLGSGTALAGCLIVLVPIQGSSKTCIGVRGISIHVEFYASIYALLSSLFRISCNYTVIYKISAELDSSFKSSHYNIVVYFIPN